MIRVIRVIGVIAVIRDKPAYSYRDNRGLHEGISMDMVSVFNSFEFWVTVRISEF